jgi:hypothetical protein
MSILPLFVFSFLLAEFVAEAQQAQSDIFDDDITISSAAFANVRVFGVELRIVRASNHTNTKSNTFFYESRPWAVCNATKNEPCAFLKHRKVPAKRSLAVVGIEFDWAPGAVVFLLILFAYFLFRQTQCNRPPERKRCVALPS